MAKRKTTAQEQEVLQHLNEVRESGMIDIFVAPKYLQDEFDYATKDARRLVKLWMANFDPEGFGEEVSD